MKLYAWSTGLLIAAIWAFVFLVLAACGKDPKPMTLCLQSVEDAGTKSFGTLEDAKCPDGQVILAIIPRWLPGGEVAAVQVKCGKSVIKCQ